MLSVLAIICEIFRCFERGHDPHSPMIKPLWSQIRAYYFVYIIRGWIIWWPVQSDSLRPIHTTLLFTTPHFFPKLMTNITHYTNTLFYLLTYLLTVLTYLKDFIYFYPRDAMRLYRGSLREQRVCLTVRLSVTSRYCIKTKKASVTISSPPGRPMILLF